MSLGPSLRARVSAVDASTDPEKLKPTALRESFAVGQGVVARVLQVGAESVASCGCGRCYMCLLGTSDAYLGEERAICL